MKDVLLSLVNLVKSLEKRDALPSKFIADSFAFHRCVFPWGDTCNCWQKGRTRESRKVGEALRGESALEEGRLM